MKYSVTVADFQAATLPLPVHITNLIPINYEVLCQLHILHTAPCYLEAICTKVPELVEKEKMGDTWGTGFIYMDAAEGSQSIFGLLIVQIHPQWLKLHLAEPQGIRPKVPSGPLPPLLHLPLPPVSLLLILALKFTQDQCYSNPTKLGLWLTSS